jgi:High potential iron-sulfur protein
VLSTVEAEVTNGEYKMSVPISRRMVLLSGLQLPIGGALLASLAACGGSKEGGSTSASGALCADPNVLSDAQQSTRTSLNYTEASPNPQQVCEGCSFFHAATPQCGTCDMFSGGPVNRKGHCVSWNAKPS